MELAGRIAVVTGAARGIGAALVDALVREGAAGVVAFDRDADGGDALARKHPDVVVARSGDVTAPAELAALVAATEARFGRIDLFCSNAGVMIDGGLELSPADWERSWAVNVMAHVHAAHAVLPGMLARGGGHLLQILSAAGMLTAPGAPAYAATKHAALGFAEWLAIAHRARGIRVTAVCPEAVDTQMLADSLERGNAGVRKIAEAGGIAGAAAVAAAALDGVRADRFLVTTHPHTLANTQRKWADPDRWIDSMTKYLQAVSR